MPISGAQRARPRPRTRGAQPIRPYPHPVLSPVPAWEPLPNPEHLGHDHRLVIESFMQQRSLVRGEAESTYRRVVAVEPANLHTIAVGGDFLMAKIQLSGIMRHLGRPDHRVEYLAGSVHLDLLTGGLREDERTVKNIRGWIDEYIVKNRIPDRLPGYGHRALNPEQKKQYNAEPEKDNNFELAVVCVTVSALLLPALAIPFILSPYATEEELAELRRLAACHS